MVKKIRELEKSSGGQAHNLDDLMVRWRDRKGVQELRPIREYYQPAEVVQEFTLDIGSEQQARDQLQKAAEKLRKVDSSLGGMSEKTRGDWLRRDLLRRKDLLQEVIRIAHGFIAEWSEFSKRPSLEILVRDNDPELATDAKRILDAWERKRTDPTPPSKAYYKELNDIKEKISTTLMSRKRNKP